MKDQEILDRINELSKEDWFKNGDDAPEDIINEFYEIETDNDTLTHLLALTASGPGHTDIWLSRFVLIGDVFSYGDGLEEGEEVTEDDIYEDNRIHFSNERERLLRNIIL
jgi:hypothetical protein